MFGVHVNWIAILVAAVANMIIGSLWYSPMMFAKEWMRLLGKKDMKMGAQTAYIWAAIISLVESYALARFITVDNATIYLPLTLMEAIKVALIIWVGFVLTTNANSVVFEGKPAKLYQMYMGYQLVAFVVMAVVIALMH